MRAAASSKGKGYSFNTRTICSDEISFESSPAAHYDFYQELFLGHPVTLFAASLDLGSTTLLESSALFIDMYTNHLFVIVWNTKHFDYQFCLLTYDNQVLEKIVEYLQFPPSKE